MADYCVTADIVRELPSITIGVSTKPSTAEVTQFCSDITADMDARMRAVGILVPITDTELLKILNPIAINGVKAKVIRANVEGVQDTATIYETLYQDAMRRIEQRPSIIRDTDDPGQPEGTERDDDDIQFTRTGDEW